MFFTQEIFILYQSNWHLSVLSVCLSAYRSVCPSVRASIYLSACLSVCLFVSLSVRMTVVLSVSLPACPSVVRRSQCSNIFFSETTWSIKAKFYMEPSWVGGTKFCSRHVGHMTKMAATPIYGKNLQKSSPEPVD